MNKVKERGFVLPKRVSCLANIIFILTMIGIAVYSFVVPKFGLSWGWIVIVILPVWAIIMANISAG
jgi:hypothetical protein